MASGAVLGIDISKPQEIMEHRRSTPPPDFCADVLEGDRDAYQASQQQDTSSPLTTTATVTPPAPSPNDGDPTGTHVVETFF